MAHILIVDDEAVIRRDLRNDLLELGHTCDEAESFIDAVTALRRSTELGAEPFDLVLLDQVLEGGASGIDVMRKMGGEYCEHRVIMLTGQRNMKLPGEAAALGAIGFQLKPIERLQLHATLETALARREAYIHQRGDIEAAWAMIEESAKQAAVPAEMTHRIEELRAWNEALKAELRAVAGTGRLSEVALQYEQYVQRFNEIAEQLPADFDGFVAIVREGFQVTQTFVRDFQELFASNRYRFQIAFDQLARVAQQPRARGTKIEGTDGEFFEYYVGREYRAYFRWVNGEGSRELVAFGHKDRQKAIIERLKANQYA